MVDYDFDSDLRYGMYGKTQRLCSSRNPTDPNDRAYGCIGDNKLIQLPFAHYTNNNYKHPQTSFGRAENGLGYDYDDRYPQWNHELWQEGHRLANEYTKLPKCNWEHNSVAYYEFVLSHFHECIRMKVNPTDMKTVTLETDIVISHVMTGVNHSNGGDYRVFGYTKKKVVRTTTETS